MPRKSLIAKANKKQRFKVRQHNRCNHCGRARGYYRKFGLCRLCLREHVLRGEVPGVIKSSW